MSGNRNIGDVARPRPRLGCGQVFVISEKSVICHRNDPAQSCQDGLDPGWCQNTHNLSFSEEQISVWNHQLLVKMNMHQWYILHKYTVRGVWPWTSRKFFTPTICPMPAHSLSVRVEMLDPGEPAQSGQCGCPLWRGRWPLTTAVTRHSDKGGEYWLTSCTAHFSSEHVQHNFRITLDSVGAASIGWPATDCWVQVIPIFTPSVGLQLLSVQIKEGVEESGVGCSEWQGSEQAPGAKLRRVQSGPGQTRGPGDHSYVSNGRWAKRRGGQEQDYQNKIDKNWTIQEYYCKRRWLLGQKW